MKLEGSRVKLQKYKAWQPYWHAYIRLDQIRFRFAVIAHKGLHVSQNGSCIFSVFKHFDLTLTSVNKVFCLVTVYQPPPPQKNGFTVERFFSEFSAFIEVFTVTPCQFRLCGDFNFHVNDNLNAKPNNSLTFFFLLI